MREDKGDGSTLRGWLGIDPGESGGVAWVGEEPSQARAWAMPKTERDVLELVLELADTTRCALIERVHAMPKQGVSSSFKFGVSYGRLRMALIACGISFEEISPAQWQVKMGCLSKGDKNVTKARAQQMFPHLKITHAIADSLLIAEFCRRRQIGILVK